MDTTLLRRGTPEFRRTLLALFASGFSTFAQLYCVQPLLPEFSREFAVNAAESSLSLSLPTGLLAVGMLVASSISDAWGRKPIMVASLLITATLTLISAFMPSWHGLLAVRALGGLALAGLPAIAMAYISEETDRKSVGLAMGLLIGGNAVGGMGGRLITGLLVEHVSWRIAIGAIGAIAGLSGLILWRSLPPSRHFRQRSPSPRVFVTSVREHLRDAGLPWLFAEAFLLMGGFVAFYNYLGYRLLAPPYALSQTTVGAIFSVYVVGIIASATIGGLADRIGRRKMLWVTILLALAGLSLSALAPLPAIVAGIIVFTFGFFAAYSIASSWVGARAQRGKAQASSVYLFSYYTGGALVGWIGGFFWTAWLWPGVVALVAAMLLSALLISLRLSSLPPIVPDAEAEPAATP
jgi:YNFM family putative membrane transporter